MNLVERVLDMIGVKKYKISSSGVYIFSCPFARWTHEGGDDRHPSFGMKPLGDDDFLFNCFACGAKGNSYKFFKLASQYGLLHYVNNKFYKVKSYEEAYFGRPDVVDIQMNEVNYDKIRDKLFRYHKYLMERGVGKEVASRFALGYDEEKRAIIFPAISNERKVVGWSYRFVDEKKYLHSNSFPRGKFLYGEHLVGDAGDCVVVEGFFDVLRVYQAGYQVVGLLGTSCTKAQFVRLINMLPPSVDGRIILFLDGDSAGVIAAKKIYDEYSSLYKIVVIDDLISQDPSDLSEEQLNEIFSKYNVSKRDEAEGRQI